MLTRQWWAWQNLPLSKHRVGGCLWCQHQDRQKTGQKTWMLHYYIAALDKIKLVSAMCFRFLCIIIKSKRSQRLGWYTILLVEFVNDRVKQSSYVLRIACTNKTQILHDDRCLRWARCGTSTFSGATKLTEGVCWQDEPAAYCCFDRWRPIQAEQVGNIPYPKVVVEYDCIWQ